MVPALALAATLAAPRIELYTMGQGAHVFERFGHAAMCVVEGGARPARCYNYGTADFGSPPEELGWNFLRGTSRFWVSIAPRGGMLAAYRRADRTIFRQKLPLTPEQARAVAEKLAHDALPQNREYLYHHFRDNCATRLRDIIDEASGGALSRSSQPRSSSFRVLGRDALAGLPLALVAGDFFVGRRADERPDDFEAMFLPDILREQVTTRFSVQPELVYRRRGSPFPDRAGATWPYVLGVAGLVAVPAWAARPGHFPHRARRIASWTSAVLLTLIGLAIWAVAMLSAVPELRENEALAVFWPTDFLLAALPETWRLHYARLRLGSVAVVALLLIAGIFQQPLWPMLLVVALPMSAKAR